MADVFDAAFTQEVMAEEFRSGLHFGVFIEIASLCTVSVNSCQTVLFKNRP